MTAFSLSLSPLPCMMTHSTENRRPSSSLIKFKGFSESSENDEVSCSDVESDSGFESGHIFVSGPGSTCSARNKAVAASKAHSEDDRRIEKAILYLDEKVCTL